MAVSDFLGVLCRNHFLEGCFIFQWGVGVVFQMKGASFLSGELCPMRGLVLMGEFLKKIIGWGVPSMPLTLCETLLICQVRNLDQDIIYLQ